MRPIANHLLFFRSENSILQLLLLLIERIRSCSHGLRAQIPPHFSLAPVYQAIL